MSSLAGTLIGLTFDPFCEPILRVGLLSWAVEPLSIVRSVAIASSGFRFGCNVLGCNELPKCAESLKNGA